MDKPIPWDITFTVSVQIYEEFKSGSLARLCDRLPILKSIYSRFPVSVRRRIAEKRMHANERIVEHPWVMMQLGLERGKVLDVGCCWSTLPIELAGLGFQVWGIDASPYFLTHPNFRFVREDICENSFSDNFFDRVLAISTIEHIGLGHYGETRGSDRDKVAMKEIYRILKPSGKALVSVPFGEKITTSSFRIYDSASLKMLVSPFHVESGRFYADKGMFWDEVSEEIGTVQRRDELGRPTCVALLTLVK
ncbi:MAG: class I SAM-dependent methyltransferase [Thermodesulfobacteriota bacterium]